MARRPAAPRTRSTFPRYCANAPRTERQLSDPVQTTFHNILEKLSTTQVQGSSWDPDSIMEYEFEPGLIDEPDQYDVNGLTPPGVLSKADEEWALKWYPTPKAKPKVLQPFPGQTGTTSVMYS